MFFGATTHRTCAPVTHSSVLLSLCVSPDISRCTRDTYVHLPLPYLDLVYLPPHLKWLRPRHLRSLTFKGEYVSPLGSAYARHRFLEDYLFTALAP